MWPLIRENPIHINVTPTPLLIGLGMLVIIWLFWLRYLAFIGNFRAGEESGSARWGTLKEGKAFRDQTNEDNDAFKRAQREEKRSASESHDEQESVTSEENEDQSQVTW